MTQRMPGRRIEEHEVRALEALAEEWTQAHGGMPLEALDGLFSALVVGPGPAVGPSEYLSPAVGEGKVWKDEGEHQHALELLTGLWNHIVWRVEQPIPDEDDDSEAALEEGFALMPFLALPEPEEGEEDEADPFAGVPEDYPVGALWAAGFLQGVSLRAEAWERLLEADEDLALDFADLVRLSLMAPEQAEEAGLDWEERFDFDERWELLLSVPGLLQDLDESRREAMVVREPIRRAPQPGRNDPCSCGSGRKYKKCCGGGTLH